MKESATQNDDLLTSWLQTLRARGDEAAESELESLIEAHIVPVIRSVIRFKLRLDSAERVDEADLGQEALAQWLAELRKLSDRPDESPINDARGLAATITYRVCYGWLRRRSPRRHALRNRLQYLLTRQAGLALWPGAGQIQDPRSGNGRGDRPRATRLRFVASAVGVVVCACRPARRSRTRVPRVAEGQPRFGYRTQIFGKRIRIATLIST